MQKKSLPVAERYTRQNHRRRTWQKVVGSLACIVVFCTTYALILPAITLENDLVCGMDEHTHTESCYAQKTSEQITTLACTYESLGVHSHTEDCRDAEGTLICGYADYVVHTHNASCLDETGTLVCQLPEVKEHQHTDDCYQAPEEEAHVHSDECYTTERGDLICEVAETAGHSHSDGCYIQNETLLCQLEETEGHTHGEGCSESVLICTDTDEAHVHADNCYETQVTCTTPESAGHTHTSECYDKVLNCDLAEVEAHQHADSCYAQAKVLTCQLPEGETEAEEAAEEVPEETEAVEPVLVCTEEEIKLHTHDEDCFETTADGTEVLICSEIEVLEHIHSDSCFETTEIPVDTESLTCQLLETEGHTHGEECYGENGGLICTEQTQAHTHSAMCFGTWELVCGLEAHSHTEECQPTAELTEEELAQVEEVIAQIDALESAEQVEANLAALEEAEDYEGYAAYYEEAAQKTQAVRDSYNALSDAQKQKVTNVAKLNDLAWLDPVETLDVDNKGTIRESLDDDWAYITDFMMKVDETTDSKTCVRTGTSPWDGDNEAGNDSSELNNILRTFDTATYTIQFNTTLRDAVAQEDVGGIKQGRLYFEFVLPLSAEEVQFETESMGWLETSQNIKYEVVTAKVNGVESQVLRGSFTLVPTGSNEAAIGASTNELNIVIRALRMQNGETIQPIFTLWLQHNDVGATYNSTDDRLPASIVTGTNHICGAEVTKEDGEVEKHDTCEAATIYGTEITVSARPMFNIGLSGINSNNTVVGTFDFDVADEMKDAQVPKVDAKNMINYGLGKVDGRMNGYGIRIELRGKAGQGMRGCEFPDEATDIIINLEVTSSYDPSNSKKQEVPDYQALYWSGDANATRGSGGFNNDGRTIYTKKDYAHSTLPFNKKSSSGGGSYMRCYDGGTWSFKLLEDDKVGDSQIQVTVSGFRFNVSDISNFPYTTTSGTKYSYNYYNPNTVNNYWEIEWAVFSAGELWLVQPFYGLAGTDHEGQYLAEVYGEGQSYTKVEITGLYMKSVGGVVLDKTSDQTDIHPEDDAKDGTSDDIISNAQYLKTPGGIDGRVIYTVYKSNSLTNSLTEGCRELDSDWTTVGSGVSLTTWLFQSKSEGEYIGVAYDNLVKFDDEFFIPDASNNTYVSGIKTALGQTYTILWAAKPDGTGWINDEEMKQATPDDLVFYATPEDLKAAGKICIGTMIEIRGVGEDSAENQLALHVHGTVRSDCEPGKVYMVTRSSYAWSKKTTADQALTYHNTKHPDKPYDSWESLTLEEWNEYLQDSTEGFPSHLNTDRGKLLTDDHLTIKTDGQWPKPFWRQDYYHCNKASTTGGINLDGTVPVRSESPLQQAYKASYDNGVYTPGNGALYYEDSCLVVPYDVTITKSTAQTLVESGETKTVYDMAQNQRTVDYVLTPNISFATSGIGDTNTAGMTTTVYIEDTLPASLTYIPGSAYYGGTYTQDAAYQTPGTCTGKRFVSTSTAGTNVPSGTYPYLETVTYNDDDTTTIRWVFNVTMDAKQMSWTENIYFSCSIGTPGVESTDVKNGDVITNTVKIWTSNNNTRPFSADYGNLDTFGITILKTSAVSLSKISDYLVMDWWDDFGFTMNIGNNSGSEKSGTIIVETLPFNGLYRSDFNGKLVVKEFSAAVVDADGNLTDSNFKFYYTTSDTYAGWLSSDYKAQLTDELTMADWIAAQNASGTVWYQLTMSDTATTINGMTLYSASDLPGIDTQKGWTDQQITSIVAVGDLAAGCTMKMHVTVKLPDGAQGDYMVNYLSQDSLSSYARAQAVNRSLEGYTWLDKDADGIQDAGEEPVSVWAILYKLNKTTGLYEQYKFDNGSSNPQVVFVQTGYQISVKANSRADAVPYDAGRYKFTDLPAGTYKVLFESITQSEGTSPFDMSPCIASAPNVGTDDTVDSDGIPSYDGTTLKYTIIEGIVMKEARELVYGMDESKYHDSGFYYRGPELPMTGGTGTTTYTMAGLMLMLCSTAYLLYRSKKRRREAN